MKEDIKHDLKLILFIALALPIWVYCIAVMLPVMLIHLILDIIGFRAIQDFLQYTDTPYSWWVNLKEDR